MRRIAITAALALSAACAATTTWAPDYVEVSPFLGTSEFDTSPLREFETTGVFLTLGWNLQARSRARLEDERHAQTLVRHAATVAHRETMRELAVGHLAREAGVSSSAVQDALEAHDTAHEGEELDLGTSLGKALTDKPATVEEAWAGLIWIGGLALLGVVIALLHVTGFLRFLVGALKRRDGV